MPQLREHSRFESFPDLHTSGSLPQSLPFNSRSRATSRASLSSTRTPPDRERTPIRRSRTSGPRSPSQSRSKVLLAYATEQQQRYEQYQLETAMLPVLRSQSAPDTPLLYPPAALPSSVSSPAYPCPSYRYPATDMPQPSAPYFNTTSGSADEQTLSALYTASSSVPCHLLPQNTALDESNVFMPQHALSTSTSPLPSFPSSFSPSAPVMISLESSTPPQSSRMLAAKPKPQCWEHGCNGRHFSTFSNLLRHQREKGGAASKVLCPYCGTEFTRTTARNGHLYGGKCKGKPDQEQNQS